MTFSEARWNTQDDNSHFSMQVEATMWAYHGLVVCI